MFGREYVDICYNTLDEMEENVNIALNYAQNFWDYLIYYGNVKLGFIKTRNLLLKLKILEILYG